MRTSIYDPDGLLLVEDSPRTDGIWRLLGCFVGPGDLDEARAAARRAEGYLRVTQYDAEDAEGYRRFREVDVFADPSTWSAEWRRGECGMSVDWRPSHRQELIH